MQSLLFRSLGLDCWNHLLQRWSYYSLCGLFALVCGGSLPSISGGNFTSPGYNGIRDYASNLDCEWTLSNPNRENSSLTIHFVRLSLESHQDCALDVLEFRVGEFKECITYLFVLPVPADNNNSYYLSSRVTKVPCWCPAEILCSQMGNGTQELRRQWDLSKESFCLRSPVWEAHPHGSWPGSVLSVCSTGAGNLFLCSDELKAHLMNRTSLENFRFQVWMI